MAFPKTVRWRLALLVSLSFALHIAYWASPLPGWNYFRMDEALYWDLAANLIDKGTLSVSDAVFATTGAGEKTLFWTPVYPALLALIIKTGLPPLPLLQLIQITLTAFVPLLLYPIASQFLRRKWLWIFLGLGSVYPYYFQLATQCGSEILALFLSLACLALAFLPAWKSRPMLVLALLGTLAACLCLTRPEYLVFSLVLFAWVSVRMARERKWDASIPIAILLASFAVWMGAWLYRNYQVTDRLVFTTRAGWALVYENEFFQAFTRGEVASEEEWVKSFPNFPTEIERYDYMRARTGAFIRKHPFEFAQLCGKRMASMALPSQAKTLIYRIMQRRDVKVFQLPIWLQVSNAVFLAGFWLLILPFGLRYFWRNRSPFRSSLLRFPLSPAGLLFLLISGQFAVYAIFAYIEYQRSIIDLELFLLGAWFLAARNRNPEIQAPISDPATFPWSRIGAGNIGPIGG